MTEPLEDAAKAYEEATKTGKPPIVAVMERLTLSRATAIRRIRAARDAGILPEAVRPTLSRKVIAVAADLGVDPEDLRAAIIYHAAGDLRVT